MIKAEWIKRLHDSGLVRNYTRTRCFEPELLDDYVGDIWLEICSTRRDFGDYSEFLHFVVSLICRYMTDNGRSRKIRAALMRERGYEYVKRTNEDRGGDDDE